MTVILPSPLYIITVLQPSVAYRNNVISAIYGFHFLTVLLLLQFLTILTRLLILGSLVLIFPYTFSCLKTCSTNMNKPCMKCAK